MKSIFKFLFGQNKEYIGLSSFKDSKNEPEPKKQEKTTVNKTSLTGMIRRVN